MNKAILVSILLIIVLTAIIVKIYYNPDKTFCKIISENPGKKINIVFFTEKENPDKATEYSNYITDSFPFNNSKEKFNFYYGGTAKCKLIQESILFCYSRELIRKSSQCKNDFIVVLSSNPSNIRSSAYGNVISLNTNQPKNVFLHEFGHAFSNLADEYVPSTIPKGAKNCAKKCDSFNNIGCFQGCSQDSFFRSSENSLMRTLRTNDFGELNIQIIQDTLNKYD